MVEGSDYRCFFKLKKDRKKGDIIENYINIQVRQNWFENRVVSP